MSPLTDVELARQLAEQAGKVALSIRKGGGFEGRALGDAGDKGVNDFLMPALREHRPDDAILCEESEDYLERLKDSRVWIVDPVDGTREFSEGRSDWAVHVGLAIDGVASVGAVALPDEGLVFTSERAAGPPRVDRAPRIVVSRTRPPDEAKRVADALGGELVGIGSAGAKAMAVVRGHAEVYLHSGGQHEWDSCAPVAVAVGHGLHCSRLDGSPLCYNCEDTRLPDLLICRPELAGPILQVLSN